MKRSRSGKKKVVKATKTGVRRAYWISERPKSKKLSRGTSLASFNNVDKDGKPTDNSGSSHSLFALLVGKNRDLYRHNLGSHFDEPDPSYGYAVHRNQAAGVVKSTTEALKGTQHGRRAQAAFDVLSGSRYNFDTLGVSNTGSRWRSTFNDRYGRQNVERK